MEKELKPQFEKLNKDKNDLAKKLKLLSQKNNSRFHKQARKNLKRTFFPKYKTKKADLANTKVLDDLDRKEYKKKIDNRKAELLEEEKKKCPFQPNVNRNFNKIMEKIRVPIIERLYKTEKKKETKDKNKKEIKKKKVKLNLKIYENQKNWKDNIDKKIERALKKKIAESYIPYEKKKNNTKYLLLNKPEKFLDRVVYDSHISDQKKKNLKRKLETYKFKPKLNCNTGVKSVVGEMIKKKYITYY